MWFTLPRIANPLRELTVIGQQVWTVSPSRRSTCGLLLCKMWRMTNGDEIMGNLFSFSSSHTWMFNLGWHFIGCQKVWFCNEEVNQINPPKNGGRNSAADFRCKNMTFQTVKMKSSHTFWVGKKKKKKSVTFSVQSFEAEGWFGAAFSPSFFFFTCVPGALFFWSQFLSAARQRNRKNASNRLLLKSQLH